MTIANHYKHDSRMFFSLSIVTLPCPGLLQTCEFHFQGCEVQFQTNVNRIHCYEIEYRTIEIQFQSSDE